MPRIAKLVRRSLVAATLAAIAAAPAESLFAQAAAQSAPGTSAKKVLGVDDYSKWRAIEGAQISGNGRWVASVLRYSNVLPNDGKPVLMLRNVETNQDVAIQHASSPTFSADSRWIVYQVDSMPARATGGRGGRGGAGADSATPPAAAPAAQGGAGGRGGAAGPQPLRRFELRELASGKTQAWKDIASATFAATSNHLILRRRPATGGGGGEGGPP